MLLLLAGIIVFLLLCLAAYLGLRREREKGFLARGLNQALFLVTLPQSQETKEVGLADYFKTVEQFYSSLAGLREANPLKRFVFGHPSFVFEIAVHRVGEEIYFYFAGPRSHAQLLEKQVLAFWPAAQIQPVTDYNIFNPGGVSLAARGRLSRSPAFPLKSFQEMGVDPLSSLTSVLTKLAREGEGAAIQLVCRRSQTSLKKTAEKITHFTQVQGLKPEEAIRAIQNRSGLAGLFFETQKILFSAPKKKEELAAEKNLPRPAELDPVQKSQVAAIVQKGSQPLFDVNLRLLASAVSESRAQEILMQLQSAFDQFSSPLLNQIQFLKPSAASLKKLFYRFSFRTFSDEEAMILSSGEMAGLFHFPQPGLSTPQIKWLKARQAPAPPNLPAEGLVIGRNVFRNEERTVHFAEDDRRRHFYLVGQTGTGKSALLKEMIRQDILAGQGLAFIDPHGETAEAVLGFVPPERFEDVIYLNPGDVERPLGLNMLEYDARFPESKTLVVNEMLEIFEKLYNLKTMGFGGPMFEQYMRNALLLTMDDPASGNTLVEIPRVLADAAFRRYKLARCQNIIVKNFWEQEAEKAGGEAALANMVPYITSKTNVFIANDLLRPIISQEHSSFNFRQVMDQSQILIINLSKGRLGDVNSYLLGMIVVGKLLIAAFSRTDVSEAERRDFYLYIDEFHNVTTKTIASALAEARKYRLSLILTHQFAAQLDEETRKAIFGNVGSLLSFRVGPDDAKYLVSEFGPVFSEQDLVNFDNYQAALKLLIHGQTAPPFNIVTFPPSQASPEAQRLVKELSRTKYGRDRALVEDELYQRLQTNA